MQVAVTGGSGFIGSHVVDALMDAGHDVTVLDLVNPYRDVNFIRCDITDRQELRSALHRAESECVYHFAGFSNSYKAMDMPFTTLKYNVEAVLNLLEANIMNDETWRLIFASTYFIDMGINNLYTTSKIAAELLIKNYADYYALPYTILRLGTVYGPRSRQEDIVSKAVLAALYGVPLTVCNGEQTRKFVYTSDVSSGCVAALSGSYENKTRVICGNQELSVLDVIKTVSEVTGAVITCEHHQSKSNGRCFVDTQWEPHVSFEQGVALYAKWLQEQRT